MVGGSFNFDSTEPYKVGQTWHDYMYFLVDSLYPLLAIFVDSCSGAEAEKLKYFLPCQEAAWKDIE